MKYQIEEWLNKWTSRWTNLFGRKWRCWAWSMLTVKNSEYLSIVYWIQQLYFDHFDFFVVFHDKWNFIRSSGFRPHDLKRSFHRMAVVGDRASPEGPTAFLCGNKADWKIYGQLQSGRGSWNTKTSVSRQYLHWLLLKKILSEFRLTPLKFVIQLNTINLYIYCRI